ncbi:hypothetical protein EK21DRAFT_88812 [Setomelanomma holmii]|uniref:Uncharacterized protein n=1 Tax=Setomelanomma holmii TaxID=210430 RepID=A0A9P4H9C3_9PLEO|nr:hypothetical protein EK21DRAFT_88812 [Setomelanomma holmii]
MRTGKQMASDDLKALATRTATTLPLTTAGKRQHFRFLDLPAELRVQVYEYLVVVGKVFYTPDFYGEQDSSRFELWREYAVPSLHVLRVCKQIRDEAEGICLAKNMFVLPFNFQMMFPFEYNVTSCCKPEYQRRPLLSTAGLSMIKNISVSLYIRSIVPLTVAASDQRPFDLDSLTPAQRLERAHEHAVWFVRHLQQHLSDALYYGMEADLKEIELDFTYAVCPLGCCRMLAPDLDFLESRTPYTARLLGVRKAEEAKVKQHVFYTSHFLGYKGEMLCNPEADPWTRYIRRSPS